MRHVSSCDTSQRSTRRRFAAAAVLFSSGAMLAIAGCGDAPVQEAPSTKQAPAPAPAPVTPAAPVLPAAPRGVWYAAPRSDDPSFPIVHGRPRGQVELLAEVIGSGVGLIDYDRDGDLDLFFPMGRVLGDAADASSDRLLRNRGDGTFEDVTAAAGVGDDGYGFGCAVGDYDRDGFDDLFVCNWGCDRLLRNRGDGTFEDATERAGVGDDDWSTCAAFGDADGDGDLDLYVARYFHLDAAAPPNGGRPCQFGPIKAPCGPQWEPAVPDLLWRNDGDGTFTDVSVESGIRAVRPSYGFALTFCDVDDDGKLDLFVGNDSLPNFLFHNLGGLRFEEVGVATGVSANLDGLDQACMGVDVADFNDDGHEDLVVTNFSNDYNTVYRNAGGMVFDDVTRVIGLGEASWWTLGWGTKFFDADCDGDLDYFVANGHLYPDTTGVASLEHEQLNHLFLQSNGRFELVSSVAGPGLAMKKSSRGAGFGDLDGDGWIELVVVELEGPPSILRATPQPGVHRALVELLPGADHRPVDHARVTVRAGGRTQTRRMNRGGSFASSNDPRVHFGLGAAATIDELVVRWPDGIETRFAGLPADRRIRIARDGAAPQFEVLR